MNLFRHNFCQFWSKPFFSKPNLIQSFMTSTTSCVILTTNFDNFASINDDKIRYEKNCGLRRLTTEKYITHNYFHGFDQNYKCIHSLSKIDVFKY